MLELGSIRALLRLAIEEDLGLGDPTSELTVPADQTACAALIAKEPLVMCGGPIVPLLFEELHWTVEWSARAAEGDEVQAGGVLGELKGRTRQLLSAERTLLNFLQRLCGVAARTRAVAAKAGSVVVLDTRKTTPGWRALEKYAVRVGGGRNHRGNLGEMILVKNNHVDANGGDMRATLSRVERE